MSKKKKGRIKYKEKGKSPPPLPLSPGRLPNRENGQLFFVFFVLDAFFGIGNKEKGNEKEKKCPQEKKKEEKKKGIYAR